MQTLSINKDIYKTLNILCVEDDPEILNTYEELFSLFFKNVYCACNGADGLELFKKYNIDLVLTDHMMPTLSGVAMSREIRKIDPTIPIILVTAMDDSKLLQDALDVNITSFLKKPFTQKSLFSTFQTSVKSIIADRMMLREQKLVIDYSRYQETKSFDKEKQIIKDESQIDYKNKKYQFSIYYEPLDILSGDSYIVKRVSENCDFIFLVDGMGKGISASITAMLCSSFMNYFVSKKIKNGEEIDLEKLVLEFFEYIQPNLLEDEAVSTNILMLNHKENKLYYSVFSMPAMLYKIKGEDVKSIPSNNPPISPYSKNVNVSSIDLINLEKMLIYTDGLNENSVDDNFKTYAKYLVDDFTLANSKDEFVARINSKIKKQEDDITFNFIKSQDS